MADTKVRGIQAPWYLVETKTSEEAKKLVDLKVVVAGQQKQAIFFRPIEFPARRWSVRIEWKEDKGLEIATAIRKEWADVVEKFNISPLVEGESLVLDIKFKVEKERPDRVITIGDLTIKILKEWCAYCLEEDHPTTGKCRFMDMLQEANVTNINLRFGEQQVRKPVYRGRGRGV